MEPALGRTPGKLTVDPNGLARYEVKLELPVGTGRGNEPELSLAYALGNPNGVLGQGWTLSGLSSIRLAPSSMPFDDPNVPMDYDRSALRYALDGQELLAINGPQGAKDTQYVTEINEYERRISHLDTGFLILGQAGVRIEYGTTKDSCVLSSDGQSVKEWRIKKQTDVHGNYVTYNYTGNPIVPASASPSPLANLNTSYVESILYTSNDVTGYKGMHTIVFNYKPRSDPVVHTVLGDKVVSGSLLSSIHVLVATSPSPTLIRSYELEYTLSTATGSSCLSKVWEAAHYGGPKQLLPTLFTYTSTPNDQDLYELDRAGIQTLHESDDNISLMPMDITGRSRIDVACLRHNSENQNLSIKSFLAASRQESSQQTAAVAWAPSTGNGAEASLPRFPLGEGCPQPSLLSADVNGDGRNDLIIPFCQSDGRLNFSLSLSTGTGFEDHSVKETYFEWADESEFMTSDVNGDGRADVIQIFPYQGNLAFRIFTTITDEGGTTLQDARQIDTPHSYGQTIQWLQVQTQRSGGKNLVRIHPVDSRSAYGKVDLLATTFSLEQHGAQENESQVGKSSLLGTFEMEDASHVSVVACDVNGDGVQDLLLCLVKASGSGDTVDWNFTITTMLNDGSGAFIQHGNPLSKTYSLSMSQMPSDTLKPRFHTIQRNCSDFPTLAYVYQESESRNYVSLNFQGTCTGFVQDPRHRLIARYADLPGDQSWNIAGADLSGHGMGDWLLWTLEKNSFTICPVYNKGQLTDYLTSVRDSMGLLSQIEYRPLADPQVYHPDVAWDNHAPSRLQSEYTLLAAPSYVVSCIKSTNDPSINSIPYFCRTEKTYRRAVVNVRGRGWQGFQDIITYDKTSDTTTTQTYSQQWPLAGQLSRITVASGRPEAGQVVQVEDIRYEARIIKLGPWTTFRPLKISQQLDTYNEGHVARSAGTSFDYDARGNVILDNTWSSSVQPLYTHYGYQMFGEVVALPTRKKVSSRASNVNLEVFESGDYSLSHSDFNPESGRLKSIAHWSTDPNAFSTTIYEFDAYGNEVKSINGTGLQIATEYDEMYHSLPVKKTETGQGVRLVQAAAYDALTCATVIAEDADGCTSFISSDPWLRCRERRKRATSVDKENLKPAKEFLGDMNLIGDTTFLQDALKVSTVPDQAFQIKCVTSTSVRHYISAGRTTYYNAGAQGQSEDVEVVDCVGKVRKKSTKHGNFQATWRYTEDDHRGCRVVESFPLTPAASDDLLDWIPQPKDCTNSTYDSLRRLITQTKSSHADDGTSVVMRRTYANGGMKQQTTISQEKPGTDPSVLSSTIDYFLNYDSEERVTKKVDESGRETLFEYNLLGQLTKITDPAGKTETREYNSAKKVTKTNDSYRNAITRVYNLSNHLIQETDGLGQKITYVRDAKGRLVEKRGDDGRSTTYKYDQSGRDWMTSICVKSTSDAGASESRFDFRQDERGRVSKQTVTIDGEEPFSINVSYDWQDRVTQKVLPDQSIMTRTYGGALLSSTSMRGDDWKVNADYQEYNASAKPAKWSINNHGSVSQIFLNEVKFDKMCFPSSHTLSVGSTQVQNHYLFNGLNQLFRAHEFGTGETTDYQYSSGRLVSYQENSGAVREYKYDMSGNVVRSGDVDMTSDGSSLRATRNGEEHFEIMYDQAGRMHQRSNSKGQFDFKYNSFGEMCSVTNKASSDGGTTEIICDHLGHTLVKKRPDGAREISVDPTYSVIVRADGSRQIQRQWRGQDRLLGTICSEVPASDKAMTSQGNQHSISLYYTDTKGNVTHVFEGQGTLKKRLRYDPFGGLLDDAPSETEKNATYESNGLDLSTMMYDFAARWYDPVACRFATPDDILDEEYMQRCDGINRHAFENNDPINHIDPTGHWTMSSGWGLAIGLTLIAASILITIFTGGVASPLAAAAIGAVTGALMSGGINAVLYSIDHADEADAGKFWRGYGATVGIGMAIGAATGAFSAGMSSFSAIKVGAQAASRLGAAAPSFWTTAGRTAVSLGSRALASGTGALVNKVGSNLIEREIYGRKDIGYFDGALAAFGLGVASGGLTELGSDSWGTIIKPLAKEAWKAAPAALVMTTGAVAGLVGLATHPEWIPGDDDNGNVVGKKKKFG